MGLVVKYLVPMAAVAMLAFAIVHVVRSGADRPLAEPPPRPGDEAVLSATGIVEAQGGNVAVASALPGVVMEVFVRTGEQVAARAALFRLEDTATRSMLQVRQAQLATAETRLARLEQPPRPDELVSAAARVRAARADLAAKRATHEHARKLHARSLIGDQDLEQRKQGVAAAEAQVEQAEAEERLLRAGPAQTDRAVARSQVGEAQALVAQAEADLQRLTTRAPCDGTILQLNIRPGEAVSPHPDPPPVILGDVRTLHVRVELEEQLLGRFRPGATGRALPRGKDNPPIPLSFVRVEPLLVMRRARSGAPGERSDTRVLPVIYKLDSSGTALHVGQQVDVFITPQ